MLRSEFADEPVGYDGFGAPYYFPQICSLCGKPARGLATIDDRRYCHEGEDPTCYMIASWAQHVRPFGPVSDWLIEKLEKGERP